MSRRRAIAALAAGVAGLLGGGAPAQAIVNGKPVPTGQLPYVANVNIAGMFQCTGTLIAPQWVLTAGHCGSLTGSATDGTAPSTLAYPVSEYSITLGTVNADGSGGQSYGVSQAIVDDGYTLAHNGGDDVTLLKLDRVSTIKPMHVAAGGERSLWQPGKLMTIAGFGLASSGASSGPSQMQYGRVPITTDALCAGAYPGQFDATTEVCAGYPAGGTDTCNGDSGGPLLAPLTGGGYVLVGATSYGPSSCGQANSPGVYARVAEGPIRSFIQSHVPEAFAAEPKPTTKKPTKPPVKKKPKKKKPAPRKKK